MGKEIPLRVLTKDGIEDFWQIIEGCRSDSKAGRVVVSNPDHLLFDESRSIVSEMPASIDRDRIFANRYELAEYVCSRIGDGWRDEAAENVGLWAWLAAAYWRQFTANKVNRQEHYIPLIGDYAKRLGPKRLDYRHCVRTPVLLYRKYGAQAKFFLAGTARKPKPMAEMGDVIEQILSRQDVFGNQKFVDVILRLYVDENGMERVGATGIPKKKRLKSGKVSKSGRGGIRRLIDGVLPRLKLTYNVYGLEPDELIKLAGPEFSSTSN